MKRAASSSNAREHDVQSAILEYLEVHRIFHWRQNVGGMKRGKHFVRFGVKGLPDICCIVNGRFIGIEVKRDKVDQSQAQVEFQVGVQHAGAKYILARHLDDVIAGLRAAG